MLQEEDERFEEVSHVFKVYCSPFISSHHSKLLVTYARSQNHLTSNKRASVADWIYLV